MLVPLMQSVFDSDKLLIIKTYPAGLVSNTDPHNQPGTRWVAMHFILPANFFTATEGYILRTGRDHEPRGLIASSKDYASGD